MEQENKNSSNQSNVSKWMVVILLLFLFPPLGVYHVWKEIKYFYKWLPILLWLFGGWTLIFSFICLTVWLPEMRNTLQQFGAETPSYPYIVLPVIILLSTFQIILGFLINKKLSSLQILPKIYQNTALICLLINLCLAPLTIILISFSISQPLYNILGEL